MPMSRLGMGLGMGLGGGKITAEVLRDSGVRKEPLQGSEESAWSGEVFIVRRQPRRAGQNPPGWEAA